MIKAEAAISKQIGSLYKAMATIKKHQILIQGRKIRIRETVIPDMVCGSI